MRKVSLLAVLIAIVSCNAHGASLIVNGSFETAPPVGWVPIRAPSNSISGWSVVQGSIDWIRTYWQPQDSSSSLDLSGSGPGGIIQTVNLIAGTQYQLTFYMSGNPACGPSNKLLTVRTGQYVSGAFVPGTISEAQFSYDITAHGATRANMQWELMTFSFTALVPATTIGFFSNTSTWYGPALDHVALGLVPEPALPVLFGTLLVALPLARRYFKK